MINNVKLMLGDAAANYTDEQIALYIMLAGAEIEGYCNRKLDAELEVCAQRMATIKLLRMNTEGLASQSFSGINENYVDGFPADILAILNRKRKIKVV